LESRLLAVADVFQALAQKRPYRDSLPSNKVLSILYEEVEKNLLDAQIVEIVRNNLEMCYKVATMPV